jgi:phosphoglycerate dehydrogenase-like enzyme
MNSAKKMKILLMSGLDEAILAEVRRIAPDALLQLFSKSSDLESEIEDADIVAGGVTPAALGRAKNLKWVHSWSAGIEGQLFPAMVESPVVLTCSKGNGAIPLAEHAMMLMMMLNRNAVNWIRAHAEKQWARTVHGELDGLTCAILGTGHSGQDLALKAKAFHMRTVGYRRHPHRTANIDRMYGRDELHQFLAEADFLVVTAPLTVETLGMLGEAEFRAMKPSAFYICFSRGGIAQDDVLYRAVDEGWIAGAGLDAHSVEPLPVDSPFWTLKNTIITPHNGATTAKTAQRGYQIFLDNLKRYVAGEPLDNVVDKALAY